MNDAITLVKCLNRKPLFDWAVARDIDTEADALSFLQRFADRDGLMFDFANHIVEARSRLLECTLPFWRYVQLVTNTVCTFCGTERVSRCPDRINSNYGYHLGNTVPICGACNMLKGAHIPRLFIALCHFIKQGSPLKLNQLLPSYIDYMLQPRNEWAFGRIEQVVAYNPVAPILFHIGDCHFCESQQCNLVCDTGVCWFCYNSHFIDPHTRVLVSGWRPHWDEPSVVACEGRELDLTDL